MIVERTKNGKNHIWAEILSSYSGGTGEWDSECKIYHGKQLIGYLDENLASDEICVRGMFDYREDGTKSDDGTPNIIDDAFYLSIGDLVTLKKIVEHWIDEEVHKEMWEVVEGE
jgi:hypothetical protein